MQSGVAQGVGVSAGSVTETPLRYPFHMVKVTSLLPDGSRFERNYPDSFFQKAWDMHMHGRRGREIIDVLIDHNWPVPPQIVDVIQDEGLPSAKSLRLWC